MDRTILHVDCNSFFASVETALHPEFAKVPMAVCGNAADRHGIVLAKNELAKKYGIVTAETIVSAKRKCKDLVIAAPHYDEYVKYSKAVKAIFERYTDKIESFGIDESWLDVTASFKLFGSGEEIAERIRREVKEEIGITVSVGVSFNKVFAKLGSDYKKPDAITVISRENYKDIVFPLPVGDLLFVGKKTIHSLHTFGIYTIGELAETSEDFLISRFGKIGHMLHIYSNGEDDSPVSCERAEQKSISNGFTFRYDIVGFEECKRAIGKLCESIGTKLRKSNLKCGGVGLKIKDVFLRTTSKQTTLKAPTDLSEDISFEICNLLPLLWEETKPVRAITVSVHSLVESDAISEQFSFFADEQIESRRERTLKRECVIDEIRERFGSDAILPLSTYLDDTGLGIK